ncbi:MAG: DUF177 domain-containing protein [Alphaproteobacteria bacterium]
MKEKTFLPELSRPLSIDKISANGVEETILAKDAERKALCKRFGLLDLPTLDAKLTVHPPRVDGSINVTGHLKADVIQPCVVTLEPLANHVEHEIDVFFVSSENLMGAGPADITDEEVETIQNGVIDLGELVAQNLGIALDPYPRKPGISYVEAEYGDLKGPSNPFAQLAELAKKPKDSE